MRVSSVEAALRDSPDDRDLWLTYSAELLERGDSRGTLIRLELLQDADRAAVRRDVAELVDRDEAAWDDGLPVGVRVRRRRHGFPTDVAVTWSDDVGETAAQVLSAPFVTTLRLVADAVDQDDLDDKEWDDDDYTWDGGPGVANRPGRLDLSALAGLDTGRLVELDLAYLDLGPDGAETLATAFDLGRLRALDLRYCRIGDAGLAALAGSAQLGGLRRLHLQRDRITGAGVPALHRFPALTELDLRYNAIGADGVDVLLAAPFAAGLTRLWLYGADVGSDGARALAQSARLSPALRTLWRCV
ncbi:hypothetical protein ACFO1B_24175 [Dactylosporangium siamense]|uniref:Leucine-rich repeat domain-containing protein n=1 Tax=Dactylosporangium siamense TaxID=685454 RepID=A0A919PNV4_9ACTN|nr:hypothetical protein [Dactylosporangium siamense]GIG47299.1 hypothetical protein Dsi01nite_053400 [Dactylosporangium siamense]